MKDLTLLIAIILLAGCTLAPPKHIATYNDPRSYEEVRALMLKQAQECWARRPRFLSEGTDISAYFRSENPKLFVIYGRQYSYSEGHSDTSVRIEVLEIENNKARVDVSATERAPEKTNNYAIDVQGWLDGNLACTKH